MDNKLDLLDVLKHLDPSELDYSEWISVGMALKYEGHTASDWEEWSAKDPGRYHAGECYRKWNTFTESTGNPVTGGTLVELAKEHGWRPQVEPRENMALDWDSEIGADDYKIIDKDWVEEVEINEPPRWDPVREITTYLRTLFQSEDIVGYVNEAYEVDGRLVPTKGMFNKTSGQLISELNACNGDIGSVIGDNSSGSGTWVRFNPLDGKGVKNENVTEFRYALVESDSMSLEKQNAILRELELPIATLVYSGGKSLHAIVKIDADNIEEYRQRVDYLYDICKKNGLDIDRQNRNPSRLSRLPGVERTGKDGKVHKQFLIDTNLGKEDWAAWHEWVEDINDELPDPEGLDEVFNNLPPLADELIHGVLRKGHKMLMAGPSKAGKSFALIELCIAIAEGREWLGWKCEKGRVLYVNLELDAASCFHRFSDVYNALGWKPDNVANVDIWNLRGKTLPMDKLAPKLIRRANKKNYIAVVIDPIYKVITGDENSADQMAHFTNQFDKICTEIGSATIYCHHHSKGNQGHKKAMDRASGSGVFARDPDALLDLTELEITEAVWKVMEDRAICKVYAGLIKKYKEKYYWEEIGQDDLLSAYQMTQHAQATLSISQISEATPIIEAAKKEIRRRTAWRVDGTLREFPKFEPVDFWFDYPLHRLEDNSILKDLEPEGETPMFKKGLASRKSPEEKTEERKNALEIAFSNLEMDDEEITVDDLAEEMGVTKRTVWNRIKEHGGFKTEKKEDKKSYVSRKN